MVKIAARRTEKQGGQALVLVALALGVFLFGAMGLAIDGSQLYAQRQMAQAAADAAAQAGIVTILNGTTPTIGASAYYCAAATIGTSPCDYAAKNGYTPAACASSASAAPGADCIYVNPNPGVAVTSLDPGTPNELQVTITRAVPMTLTKMLGFSNLNVTAMATAAILDITQAPPIIITHPTKPDALDVQTADITICGGPQRSIQVNSSATEAWTVQSTGNVNLDKGGPTDTAGNCTGHGSDFGSFGGPLPPSVYSNLHIGTTGHYLSPADPIQDPLAFVNPPATTGLTSRPSGGQGCGTHCSSCPNGSSCQEYLPGLYASGVTVKNNDAIFDPGIYYIQSGGFTTKNAAVKMCPSPSVCAADTNTANGMLVYDTGAASGGCDVTGGFTVDTGSNDTLLGAGLTASNLSAAPVAPYYGILFFEDRNACAHTGNNSHTIGQGTGQICVIGTMYITNTLPIMTADATHYQAVDYNGNPATCVNNYGEIIVSTLKLVGTTSSIKMTLLPLPSVILKQIALVNGE